MFFLKKEEKPVFLTLKHLGAFPITIT